MSLEVDWPNYPHETVIEDSRSLIHFCLPSGLGRTAFLLARRTKTPAGGPRGPRQSRGYRPNLLRALERRGVALGRQGGRPPVGGKGGVLVGQMSGGPAVWHLGMGGWFSLLLSELR